MRQVDVADLAAGVRAGSRQHVARAITLLESTRPTTASGRPSC